MRKITITIPPDLELNLENLISQGIYKDMETAVLALVRAGLLARKRRKTSDIHIIPDESPPILPFKPPEKWPDHYEFKK
jgi:Arc/MetJ-type ribon-helix-helix transcriptional regulator